MEAISNCVKLRSAPFTPRRIYLCFKLSTFHLPSPGNIYGHLIKNNRIPQCVIDEYITGSNLFTYMETLGSNHLLYRKTQ